MRPRTPQGTTRRLREACADRRRPDRTEKIWLTPSTNGSAAAAAGSPTGRSARSSSRCGTWSGKQRGSRCGSSSAATATRSWPMADDVRRRLESGLETPEDYGRFADWLVQERGYKAVKLHTWMPPIPGAPNVKLGLPRLRRRARGRRARHPADARSQPLVQPRRCAVARASKLEELGFLWMEEPMEEARISLLPLALRQPAPASTSSGPRACSGKHWTRAEWVAKGACDMLRTGVWDVGGIGPSMKVARLAESFGMSCEVHGTGAGNLAVAAAIAEHDLLRARPAAPVHRLRRAAGLSEADRRRDGRGRATSICGTSPGLGQDIDFDYIEANLVKT